eukprot:5963701-Pleurochrysis_carterae.AAC.1
MFGDGERKLTYLYIWGAHSLVPTHSVAPVAATSRHDRVLYDPDERDRWRSRTPVGFARALARNVQPTTAAPARRYAQMLANMARVWTRG